jgi:hypothetical protein
MADFKVKVFFKESYCIEPEVFIVNATNNPEALEMVKNEILNRGTNDTGYLKYPWEEMYIISRKEKS